MYIPGVIINFSVDVGLDKEDPWVVYGCPPCPHLKFVISNGTLASPPLQVCYYYYCCSYAATTTAAAAATATTTTTAAAATAAATTTTSTTTATTNCYSYYCIAQQLTV